MLGSTITAIATGYDTGAISMIRLSGDKTYEILSRVFTKDLSKAASHTIHHGYIRDPESDRIIDEVVVNVYRAPKTYTGEDLAEICCHGGTFVTGEVLSVLLANGAELAARGEFTQRAYLNGRMDLTEAEAVNDIINARHMDQLVLAGQELRGGVRKLLDPLMEEMVAVIGNIEVNIDYPEYEDIEVVTMEKVRPAVVKWLGEIDEILNRSRSGKIVREGVMTAIVGRTNVGKSSLLNAFLQEDKAIVTDIPGTTRDIVEGEIRLANITLRLLDTAGIRQTGDTVENLGIRKSLDTIEKAQLVILVLDGSRELTDEDQELMELTKDKNRIVVYNKADISSSGDPDHITISAKNGEIGPLVDEINRRYQTVHEAVSHPGLSNQRQIGLLQKARNSLMTALEAIDAGIETDLVTVDLNEAHNALREIEGTYTKEDLLDDIFSRFCLGK